MPLTPMRTELTTHLELVLFVSSWAVLSDGITCDTIRKRNKGS